jgi:hypothetical protein
MTSRFIQQEALINADDKVNKYRHSSGLLHVNIIPNTVLSVTNKQDVKVFFSAAIFIKTPSNDDSGVAHAVEHLIFRRSAAYPEASTLFQLTSLTDAKINASTLDGFTCFHCSCSHKASFELIVNYLIEGVLSPIITQEELTQEIFDGVQSGVIYRELLGYQMNPDYLEHIQILRGDTSPHKIHCHGGVTDCLHQLTLAAITHYHQTYYHAGNIQIITMTPDIDKLQNRLAASLDAHCSDNNTKSDTPRRNNNTPTTAGAVVHQTPVFIANSQHSVYTWWVDIGYYNDINAIASDLADIIAQAGAKLAPISSDTNALHQFAIRVISCQQQILQIQRHIIEQLCSPTFKHTISDSVPDHSNKQYPKQINHMIQLYKLNTQPKKQKEYCSLLEQLSLKPFISGLATIEDNVNSKTVNSAQHPLIHGHFKPLPLTHQQRMIKPLLAIHSQTIQMTDHLIEPTQMWSSFIVIELQHGINPYVLAAIVKQHYQLETLSLANLVLVNHSDQQTVFSSLPELSTIITENQSCERPNIPLLLHRLYRQLDRVTETKNQVNSNFKLITSDELKEIKHCAAFNVNVTRSEHAWCEQHWLCRVTIDSEQQLIAWLVSYVIGASSHFLQPRLSGECYSISSVYSDASKELLLYSAFDINAAQRMESVSSSLLLIAEDIDFLSDALILAKHKLRHVYQHKHQKLSSEHLKKLSLLTQGIYEQQEFESLLSKISSETLADFLKNVFNSTPD